MGDSIRLHSAKPAPIIPNHQRVIESAKESQICVWIYKLLDEVAATDYGQLLRDGCILIRLMNAIKEGSVGGEASPGENIKHKRKNIERFLAAASAYGVPNEKLFAVDDLLLLQNLPRVTTCIFELGKLAEADRGFSGPQLGDLPYEPIDPKTKRRAGMPEGDDIHVAHVDIRLLKRQLSIGSEPAL